MHFLSLCAIVKNETPYLEEWINFHLQVGYEHFFIYDNESTIPVKTTLSRFIEKNLVSVIDFPGAGMQMPAYTHCIKNFGKLSKWISFFDADEFAVPQIKNTLPEILEEYNDFGGVNFNWAIFGSNGHISKPNGLIIENYTKRMAKSHYENTHTKATVRTERTIKAGTNPHYFVYKHPYYSVSENKEKVNNAWTPHHSEKLLIHHYFTKSFDEFKIKITRGRADVNDPKIKGRQLEDFKIFDDLCVEDDFGALRFVEQVKKNWI